MYRRCSLIPVAFLLASCARPETAEQAAARMQAQSAAARTMIAGMNVRWAAYMAGGHMDSLAMMYTETAHMMGANAPVAIGREAIRTGLTSMLQAGTWHFTITTDSVWANGGLVVEQGHWTYHLARAAGAPAMDTTDSGSYMVRWAKVGEQWLMADDIYNSERPMMAPSAAPRRRG